MRLSLGEAGEAEEAAILGLGCRASQENSHVLTIIVSFISGRLEQVSAG